MFGNNAVAIADLPAVITVVIGTLRSVTQGEAEKPAEASVPAVPIKKSIETDFLACLEDGHSPIQLASLSQRALERRDVGRMDGAEQTVADASHSPLARSRTASLRVPADDRPRPAHTLHNGRYLVLAAKRAEDGEGPA